MLESIRKGQRWLTFLFVATIGLVFVFFFGTGAGGGLGPAGPTGMNVVELDDVQLSTRDYAREKANTEQRLRDQLGDAYDEVGAERFLDSQALSSLVNGVVLAEAARELGLHVTKEELRRVVQTSPLFIDEQGLFDPELFDRFAVYNFGSQRLFIQNFSRDLLGQKLVQLLAGHVTVSDAEVDLQARYEAEQARIAFVALDPTALPPSISLTDEEIATWADAHEAELTALYEARRESLARPERVRARHILIRLADSAPEADVEEARARAEAARERILAGEDFGQVAEALSQDAGTAAQGGDLGVFARGQNDPTLDEAAFSLELGTVSEPVRTPYGFHLIRVEEQLPAQTPSFEEVRLELAREAAAEDRARTLAESKRDFLIERIEAGSSLEDAAREADVAIERPSALKRRPDGFVPGLGAADSVITAAFALEPGSSSPEVHEIGEKQVLIQVLERTSPSEAELAGRREALRERLLVDKQNQVVSEWLDATRRRLEEQGRLRVNAELALGN